MKQKTTKLRIGEGNKGMEHRFFQFLVMEKNIAFLVGSFLAVLCCSHRITENKEKWDVFFFLGKKIDWEQKTWK